MGGQLQSGISGQLRSESVANLPRNTHPGFAVEDEGFLFEHAQLLADGKDLKTKIASRTEKGTEKEEYWDHGLGFISYLIRSEASAKSMIPHNYGVLATDNL
jgi:hypothetical protein